MISIRANEFGTSRTRSTSRISRSQPGQVPYGPLLAVPQRLLEDPGRLEYLAQRAEERIAAIAFRSVRRHDAEGRALVAAKPGAGGGTYSTGLAAGGTYHALNRC